jgi:hypothetical protein
MQISVLFRCKESRVVLGLPEASQQLNKGECHTGFYICLKLESISTFSLYRKGEESVMFYYFGENGITFGCSFWRLRCWLFLGGCFNSLPFFGFLADMFLMTVSDKTDNMTA